jgi:hypothetical protein
VAYALDDGEDICLSTSPIQWVNGAADVDPTAFTSWLPYSAWRIIAGDWTEWMTIGDCCECHVDFASHRPLGFGFSHSPKSAPLSADVDAFGRGVECPD